MDTTLALNLNWLGAEAASLKGMRRGLEKESLRVTADGQLAQTAHQHGLGSALTHPWITTDYSEALIELITPATYSISETLAFLDDIHRFVHTQIGDEMLWANSMPCALEGDEQIPLAQYGHSNIGRMKTLYRHGLGVRYGRRMQTIAGIHYNLSFPDTFFAKWQEQEKDSRSLQDFRSEKYFGLVRNFQRQSWLLLYLLGASPAVCSTFLRGRQHQLQENGKGTLYLPKATSLRMSSLGYQNTVQAGLQVSYNGLNEYVHDLDHAIRTPYSDFEKIGLKNAEGGYQQINTNILQIENEYYGLIRPKRTTQSGERPTTALSRRGVEYVELRCVDLNPFNPIGIDATSSHFLEAFALHCLLREAKPFTDKEYECLPKNQQQVVEQGRTPDLMLHFCGNEQSLSTLAHSIMEELKPVADILDSAHGGSHYREAINKEKAKLENPDSTFSAQVLTGLKEHDDSFSAFTRTLSQQRHHYFKNRPLTGERAAEFARAAEKSHQDQAAIEAADNRSFPDFLADYFRD